MISYVVYQIKNLINNKIYIGSSKSIEARRKDHFTKLNTGKHKNPHLQAAYNKYGKEAFEFSILHHSCYGLYRHLEQFYLDNIIDFSKDYNIYDDVFKSRITKKVYSYDLNKNFYKNWDNIDLACIDLNVNPDNIKNSIRRGHPHKNLLFFYENNLHQLKDITIDVRHKPVYQFDLKGNFIKKWNSKAEAQIKYPSYIMLNVLDINNKQNKSCCGFIWSWNEKCPKDYIRTNIYKDVKVCQWDYNFKLVNIWDNIESIILPNQTVNKQLIKEVCQKKRKNSRNFIWTFYKESPYTEDHLLHIKTNLIFKNHIEAAKYFNTNDTSIRKYVRKLNKYDLKRLDQEIQELLFTNL